MSDYFDFTDSDGRTFRATVERDDHHGTPWEECDGHGPVTEYETRDKESGELILCGDGRGGLGTDRARRFYDLQAATAQAIAESWGFLPYPMRTGRTESGKHWAQVIGPAFSCRVESWNINAAVRSVYDQWAATFPSRKAYHAAAARADYERLRDWCNDSRCYVTLSVAPFCPCCGAPDDSRAEHLGGIESDCREYLEECARELAAEIERETQEQVA